DLARGAERRRVAVPARSSNRAALRDEKGVSQRFGQPWQVHLECRDIEPVGVLVEDALQNVARVTRDAMLSTCRTGKVVEETDLVSGQRDLNDPVLVA